MLSEEGPSHSRRFRVECRLDDGSVTTGEGSSKKAAQQAARAAQVASTAELARCGEREA